MEGKLDRVFRFVLGHEDFSFLGSSRTDSGVSCRLGYVQLFLREKADLRNQVLALNTSLGGEIQLEFVGEVPRSFNLIQAVKQKTYKYFFADSSNFHPFASSFIAAVEGINSFPRLAQNASLFEGSHDFRAFCKISENKTDYIREVLEAKIYLTQDFQGKFFPEKVYCFEVIGTGFLHHQVRKMVHAIWCFSHQEIKERLENPSAEWKPVPTAPANGLILWETVLENCITED